MILDFTAGEDEIALHNFQLAAFSDLDTTGDGFLNDADLDVMAAEGSTSIAFAGFGGDTALTVFRVVDGLTAADISFANQDYFA